MITSSFFIGRKTLAEALHAQALCLGITGCQPEAFGSWRSSVRRWGNLKINPPSIRQTGLPA
jgi:hypothetical protein